MFALWPFNPERSLKILVSGSIADFSWTLEAVWLTVCRHHVLLGSRSGQTHSFTYTHIHTSAPPAPPVPLIPKHVTWQTWDLVTLPTSRGLSPAQCFSDLPWWNLQNPLSPSSHSRFVSTVIFRGCVLVVPLWSNGFAICTECGSDTFGLSLLPFMWFSNSRCSSEMAGSYLTLTYYSKDLSQEEMEPVGSELNL